MYIENNINNVIEQIENLKADKKPVGKDNAGLMTTQDKMKLNSLLEIYNFSPELTYDSNTKTLSSKKQNGLYGILKNYYPTTETINSISYTYPKYNIWFGVGTNGLLMLHITNEPKWKILKSQFNDNFKQAVTFEDRYGVLNLLTYSSTNIIISKDLGLTWESIPYHSEPAGVNRGAIVYMGYVRYVDSQEKYNDGLYEEYLIAIDNTQFISLYNLVTKKWSYVNPWDNVNNDPTIIGEKIYNISNLNLYGACSNSTILIMLGGNTPLYSVFKFPEVNEDFIYCTNNGYFLTKSGIIYLVYTAGDGISNTISKFMTLPAAYLNNVKSIHEISNSTNLIVLTVDNKLLYIDTVTKTVTENSTYSTTLNPLNLCTDLNPYDLNLLYGKSGNILLSENGKDWNSPIVILPL